MGIINEDVRKMCDLLWNLRHNVHLMKEISGLEVTKEIVDAAVSLMTTVIRNLSQNILTYQKTIQERMPELEIDIGEIVERQ